jgi:hypothetical protein
LSSFAGNELLISPDWLIEDELLQAADCKVRALPQNEIDYPSVITLKRGLLQTARANFTAGARADLRVAYEQFCHDQAHWLCSSHSTATPKTPIFLETSSPTPWSTPLPMTIRRLAAGLRNYRTISNGICGTTSRGRAARAARQPRC